MNHTVKFTLTIIFAIISTLSFAGGNDGHEIKVTINTLKENETCQLAYYYGNKQYIKDSAKVNSKGQVVFKGEEKLPQGVYLFVLPNKSYFDFIVDEPQHMSIVSDTTNFVKNMQVKGSKENELFFEYQRFIMRKQNEQKPISETYKLVKDNEDSVKILREQMTRIKEEVESYQQKIMDDNENSFIALFIKATIEPTIPPVPESLDSTEAASFPYRYFKAHFFDNINVSDDRMLRTPFFNNKIERYLEKMTVPDPDSISASCDVLINLAKPNDEVFKYMVWYLTLKYETSKFMGMDAVFVHLVDNYYKTGLTTWVDSTTMAKITKKSDGLKPTLIGKNAPSLNLKDTSGRYISLYDVKAEYTILVFWDHDCGHCKKAIPKLGKLYNDTLKGMGVEVYAMETEDKFDEWRNFISENELSWINVHETDEYYRAVAKQRYHINSTPMVFILDKNKKIVAKKVDVEQTPHVIGILKKKAAEEAKKK